MRLLVHGFLDMGYELGDSSVACRCFELGFDFLRGDMRAGEGLYVIVQRSGAEESGEVKGGEDGV